MRSRRRIRGMALVTTVVVSVVVRLPAAAGPMHGGNDDRTVLRTGGSVFFDGEHVELAVVPDEALCHTVGPCWEYPIQIDPKDDPWRLRVAIGITFDSPDHVRAYADPDAEASPFRLVVTDPDGQVRRADLAGLAGIGPRYHRELWWEHPAPGTWTLRVVPLAARDIGFRLRAALEPEPDPPRESGLLMPDLRSVPPFELGFTTPTISYGPGVRSPSAPLACMAEEVEEAVTGGREPPRACLRLSLGVENVGLGPLLFHHDDCGLVGTCIENTLTQHAYETDPQATSPPYWRHDADWEHDAGEGRWHRTHRHLHYEGMYAATLFRIVRTHGAKPPRLEALGDGRKVGFAPSEEWLADWDHFSQQDSECCYQNHDISLAPGWGDIYEWNRSGNVVDFPVDALGRPEPGEYLIGGRVDPEGRIAESDEGNNASYVHFRVGQPDDPTAVRVLERGYGDHPWDPKRRPRDVTP